MTEMRAPFPWFGGKRDVAADIWARFGKPKQYIEPFCGSAAVLLATNPASLEVINDLNGFVANFWRAVRHQPEQVAMAADYPVSHIDLGARHRWLMEQRARIGDALQDPNWRGDEQVAGWWLWGQCCWIGSGWCEWLGKIPHASDAGRGVQAIGQIPHASDAGMGVELLTSSGVTAWHWLRKLSARLERVRVVHGDWDRCLNNHYGGDETAVFLDPPYRAYEALYGADSTPVADAVEGWARQNSNLRVALCGHIGDYTLDGWTTFPWTRKRLTYSGSQTTNQEAIWFSPACIDVTKPTQCDLFGVTP